MGLLSPWPNMCITFLLLASGWWILDSAGHREYILIKNSMNQSAAQAYFRQRYIDLAVVENHDDLLWLKQTTEDVPNEVWLGLTRSGESRWQWSVGQTPGSSGLMTYHNWAMGQPQSSHSCAGMMKTDGQWVSADCGSAHPYVCQTRSGELRFVADTVTWRQAQSLCRQNHFDLASAMNPDQSQSSFRNWDTNEPGYASCVIYNGRTRLWWDRQCDNTGPFFCCYSEEKIEHVRVEIKSNTLDFGAIDSAVPQEILNQIEKEGIQGTIKWLVQPDGKIFHKKEKRKMGRKERHFVKPRVQLKKEGSIFCEE